MLILLFVCSIIAGIIDSIAGGSGLIMVPSFMLAGFPVPLAIGTNKLCNVIASFTSGMQFARRKLVNWSLIKQILVPAVLGTIVGSRALGLLDKSFAEPVVVVLIVGVILVVLLRPQFGEVQERNLRLISDKTIFINKLLLYAFCFFVGFHDGFFGPGAGIFYIFTLIFFANQTFLFACGNSKIINLLTSIVALVNFLYLGQVDLKAGVVCGIGIMFGSYFGASIAIKNGTRLVKPVFVSMGILLVAKILLVN